MIRSLSPYLGETLTVPGTVSNDGTNRLGADPF